MPNDLGQPGITWADRLDNLRKALGRPPTLEELLEASSVHQMTPDEYRAQQQSWVRACKPTGDPRID